MDNEEAYNMWSPTYDSVENKTRDLEARASRSVLSGINFSTVIKLGCGTGKNTAWLAEKARKVVAVDFSAQMLEAARRKINKNNVEFIVADIRNEWDFAPRHADLVTCSLVLEHVENLEFIFSQANEHLSAGSFFYIGELHPFRQYEGSRARFETESGTFILECFTHHLSEYIRAATTHGFSCVDISEWFDGDSPRQTPRIIAFSFQKA